MLLEHISSLIEQYDATSTYYPTEYRGISGTIRKYAGDIGAGALGISGTAVTGNPLVGAGIYGGYKALDTLSGKHQEKDKTYPAAALAGLTGAGLALKFGPSVLNKIHNYAIK